MAGLSELDRRAVRAFAAESTTTRAHVVVRAATCPLAAIDALVPPAGDVLDVGCGHGLSSIRMALSAPERRVLGVDIDADKLHAARRAAAAAGVADRVRFEQVDQGWLPPVAAADVVVCIDVAYLLPPPRRGELLSACAGALTPGGTLVVKEMAPRPRPKAWLASAQEQVSVRLLGITRGDGVHRVDLDEVATDLLAQGLTLRRVDLSRAYLHPHLALVAHRPSG